MVVKWGEVFQAENPGMQFDISAGGAGKGMADALSGAVDIGMVSRQIYQEEVDQGALGFSVTKDAVFLTVSAQNPYLDELMRLGITPETLMGIYITGEITTWGDLIGRPEVIDPIHIYTRSDACGAGATWAEFLGGVQEDLLGIGVYGDPGVLEAVIKDPLSIGYNNLNYAYDFSTGLAVEGAKVPPLDINRNGSADPEEVYETKESAVTAVNQGKYPSPPARDLYLVTQGQPSELTAAFIKWVLTDGQPYVSEMGYVALSSDLLAQELTKINP
jgi:phosphate transport system substrate-binding protein